MYCVSIDLLPRLEQPGSSSSFVCCQRNCFLLFCGDLAVLIFQILADIQWPNWKSAQGSHTVNIQLFNPLECYSRGVFSPNQNIYLCNVYGKLKSSSCIHNKSRQKFIQNIIKNYNKNIFGLCLVGSYFNR